MSQGKEMPEEAINWTKARLRRFKKVYRLNSMKPQDQTFQFEGNTFVVGYAKYLIQYLETQLNRRT